MTEMFIELENGQVEVNWDSLELLTSAGFVADIKSLLSLEPTSYMRSFSVIKILHDDSYVSVYVSNGVGCRVFRYSFITGSSQTLYFTMQDVAVFAAYGHREGLFVSDLFE